MYPSETFAFLEKVYLILWPGSTTYQGEAQCRCGYGSNSCGDDGHPWMVPSRFNDCIDASGLGLCSHALTGRTLDSEDPHAV